MKYNANWVLKNFPSLKPLLDTAQISGKQRLELSIVLDAVDLTRVEPKEGQTVLLSAAGDLEEVRPVDFYYAEQSGTDIALSKPLTVRRVVGALRLMPHGSRQLTIFCSSELIRQGTAELRNQLAPLNLSLLRQPAERFVAPSAHSL